MKPPPVHLTAKTREMLRLLASDPVMVEALYFATMYTGSALPSDAMLLVSTMDDERWQELEETYRA